ncbi:hypothetical protein KSP35_08750 [Aquihabitans sp. G128]|uniref:hypothetical protein n=1 Tax=Aquihabitans sp. G128 TaxID=2849779 RepID=UPI001C245A93|nr:hypothetical protein [Aquihabitans sp. G128]QXC62851.1 hypothetical protein KSP35_08750 [Aquihabitans sp. G128]
MRARHVALLLVVVACLAVVGALWLGLTHGSAGAASCGPIATQGQRKDPACDDFYRTRYVEVAVLLGVAAATYLASVVIERRVLDREVVEGEPDLSSSPGP